MRNMGREIRAYSIISRRDDIISYRPDRIIQDSKRLGHDIQQIPPFRRIGFMSWNEWCMYSIVVYSSPADGDFVKKHDMGVNLYLFISRWLLWLVKRRKDHKKGSPGFIA